MYVGVILTNSRQRFIHQISDFNDQIFLIFSSLDQASSSRSEALRQLEDVWDLPLSQLLLYTSDFVFDGGFAVAAA